MSEAILKRLDVGLTHYEASVQVVIPRTSWIHGVFVLVQKLCNCTNHILMVHMNHQLQCLTWCQCTNHIFLVHMYHQQLHCPLFEMVQMYQQPHPFAPILCNAPLMRSSLHVCCVHAHNVAIYHWRGGLNNCQVEQSFLFQWAHIQGVWKIYLFYKNRWNSSLV